MRWRYASASFSNSWNKMETFKGTYGKTSLTTLLYVPYHKTYSTTRYIEVEMLTRAQFNVIIIVVQILELVGKITISSGASHSFCVTCQISQLLISFIFHLISGYSSTI